MKGYKVSEVTPWGVETNEYYTTSLQKARSEVARRLWALRKDENVHKDRKHPFKFQRGKEALEDAMLSVQYWVWRKCSYEYDEWDTYPWELCLWEIEIVEG